MKINYSFTLAIILIFIMPIFYPKIYCEHTEGKWIKGGLAQKYICIHKYLDAGKPCASSKECLGGCIVSPKDNKGYCKEDSNPFGCYTYIDDKYGIIGLCGD